MSRFMNSSLILRVFLILPFASLCAWGELNTKVVRHQLGDLVFESTIVYPDSVDELKPGILMVPNWMGPTGGALDKAKKIAGDSRVVMMADVYSIDVRPANGGEAGAAAGVLRGDRELMRERVEHVLEIFKREAEAVGMDTSKMAAVGFCFGGGAVLEYARTGASIDAVLVSRRFDLTYLGS